MKLIRSHYSYGFHPKVVVYIALEKNQIRVNFYNICELAVLLSHKDIFLPQVLSSCFAGVYNEFLLKDTGVDVHIMMANVFMYLNSIVCNAFILLFKGEFADAVKLADNNIAKLIRLEDEEKRRNKRNVCRR